MNRPTTHQTMFEIARATAKRSTCPAARVGTVIARDGVVVACGYNGAPRGVEHCDVAGCVVIPAWHPVPCDHCAGDGITASTREYSRHVHSEENAIVHCARDGRSTDGCELYVTTPPCLSCALLIIQAGITRIHIAPEGRAPYEEWTATVGRFLSGHVGVVWHNG